jgi:hypothetical protein
MNVAVEAAGTCLVSTGIFFVIGRYVYYLGRNSPVPAGHVFGVMGTFVGAAQEYKSGVSLWALLIICALIWSGLWVTYRRFTKGQPRI